MLTLPKAILFDWDNTLVDTWRICHEALNMTYSTFHMPELSEEAFLKLPHLSMKDRGPIEFGRDWPQAEKTFYGTIEAIHLTKLRALDGAQELLEEIAQKGIYTGIVSNKRGDILRKEVQHLGWNSHFSAVVGSRDASHDKPSQMPVKMALLESGINHGRDVWFIGDTLVDVDCANRAGCIPIIVGEGEAASHKTAVPAGDCKGVARLLQNV